MFENVIPKEESIKIGNELVETLKAKAKGVGMSRFVGKFDAGVTHYHNFFIERRDGDSFRLRYVHNMGATKTTPCVFGEDWKKPISFGTGMVTPDTLAEIKKVIEAVDVPVIFDGRFGRDGIHGELWAYGPTKEEYRKAIEELVQ